MEQVFIKAAQLIVSLSLLVFIHELGHFMFAKLFKTKVEKFYLFFNPWFTLFKKKIGETEYGIGWLPLGGYTKIAGMVDESMDKEAMKKPAQPWEFRSKTTGQRLLIMIGGVLMNFILAFIIYIGVLYAWGESYLSTNSLEYGISVSETGQQIGLENGDKILSLDGEYLDNFYKIIPTVLLDDIKTVQVLRDGQKVNVPITDDDIALMLKSKGIMDIRMPFNCQVAKVIKDSPADIAGFEKKDAFVSIDGNEFQFYDQFKTYLSQHKNQNVKFIVRRNGELMDIPVTVSESGTIGFYTQFDKHSADFMKYKATHYSFFGSIPAGVKKGYLTTVNYLKQFKLIFSPKTKAYESLGGFIAIGNIFPGQWDWFSFWNMTAFLSIILGIMNLLPIPALDGGHVMFLFFEMITGRKPGERFMEYAQIAGMGFLLLLVIYANANDIIKLFH